MYTLDVVKSMMYIENALSFIHIFSLSQKNDRDISGAHFTTMTADVIVVLFWTCLPSG